MFGLNVSLETLTLGLPADAVGLGILDARRMRLYPDAEGDTEIKRLFIGESELGGEEGQTNLCGHGFLIGFAVGFLLGVSLANGEAAVS